MSSPREHPQVAELIRLRESANALCAEFTELEFRDERGDVDEQDKARLVVLADSVPKAVDALRTLLLSLRSDDADVLASYYSFEVQQAELVAARNPEDRFARIKVKKWQRVAAGETDDISFVRILSE